MGEVDLRDMAHELRRRLREKKFILPAIDPILTGFSIIKEKKSIKLSLAASYGEAQAGDPPKLAAAAKRWSKEIAAGVQGKKAFVNLWHTYQKGFERAVDYLRTRFNVYDENYLP